MLISSSAVVERMVTGCGGELKAPVVKQKKFELKRKEGKFFQTDLKGTNGLSFFVLPCRAFKFSAAKGVTQHHALITRYVYINHLSIL